MAEKRGWRTFSVAENPLVSSFALLDSFGAVAQLGERGVRNAEVRGSIPLRSTEVLGGEVAVHWPRLSDGSPPHLAGLLLLGTAR